ncbi:RICIN domain-containing protein [Microseira wollei]|uniref:Extracellular exo-alpha-L-arabinofuranosidase n=1 Tax=Microseira wollei NIES-4236 TaxID=2530354 RepID=A0AAV3X5C7_9CYAN|nr:RICIN domain-containing protein [Microseira wollei]GET35801.1 extracellular exo-alpha-L-arabinofuranosidase [Microseira wollei NIES-4236]
MSITQQSTSDIAVQESEILAHSFSGTVVILISWSSGKALDVRDLSKDDGAKIQQWTKHGGANQQWRFDLRNGGWTITSISSGKVLEVPGFSNDDGAQIQQWSYNGGNNQLWRPGFIIVGSRPSVTLRNVASNKNLDLPGFSNDNGTIIQQWSYTGKKNQVWEMEYV